MKAALVFVVLFASPAGGQALNCAAPQTQLELTGCAARAFETADTLLNQAWGVATERARQMDAGQPGLVPTNFDMLLDAQRAWIPFRDKACSAESTLARGGSMQNMLFYICLERLTQQRTEDLRLFGSVN